MGVFAILDRRLGGNYYQFYFLFATKSTTSSTSKVLPVVLLKYYRRKDDSTTSSTTGSIRAIKRMNRPIGAAEKSRNNPLNRIDADHQARWHMRT